MAKWTNQQLEYLRTATPDQKLKILQIEMVTPLEVVRGVATILKGIDSSTAQGLPEKFEYMIDILAQAGDDLKALLDTATLQNKLEEHE